jgi:hypothetical protein
MTSSTSEPSRAVLPVDPVEDDAVLRHVLVVGRRAGPHLQPPLVQDALGLGLRHARHVGDVDDGLAAGDDVVDGAAVGQAVTRRRVLADDPALGHRAGELPLLVELPGDLLVGHDLLEHVVVPGGPPARQVGHGGGVGAGGGPGGGAAAEKDEGHQDADEAPLPAAPTAAAVAGVIGAGAVDERGRVVEHLGRGLLHRRLRQQGEVDVLQLP